MHPVAIEKAKSRLRVAKKALEDVKKSHTMESFHDAWYSFGEKARQRIADPLLHYLYEARNDDEHGLTRNTRRVPEKLGVGVARP